MALVFTSPRAWKSAPARSNSMGSATSEGCAKLRSRVRTATESRKPYARAMRVIR
jgi:hypothetical protein